jgi:hypothetical protein
MSLSLSLSLARSLALSLSLSRSLILIPIHILSQAAQQHLLSQVARNREVQLLEEERRAQENLQMRRHLEQQEEEVCVCVHLCVSIVARHPQAARQHCLGKARDHCHTEADGRQDQPAGGLVERGGYRIGPSITPSSRPTHTAHPLLPLRHPPPPPPSPPPPPLFYFPFHSQEREKARAAAAAAAARTAALARSNQLSEKYRVIAKEQEEQEDRDIARYLQRKAAEQECVID